MEMAFLVAAYVLLPAGVLYLRRKSALLDKIGTVILCYGAGFVLAMLGPDGAAAAELKNTVSSAAVALALPLLLFSVNVGAWSRLAGKATLSMVLAFASVIVVVSGGYFLVRDVIPAAWQLGGMAVGLYTGGTPNLAAIGTALGVDADLYIAMHTYDTVIGVFYLLFAMSLAKPLFGLFLPRFGRADGAGAPAARVASQAARDPDDNDVPTPVDVDENFDGILQRATLLPLLGAFGLAALIVGVSVGLSGLVPGEHADAVTILSITALAVAASFVPAVRAIKRTFPAGMYFIYIFSIAVGSMADFRGLLAHINGPLLLFVTLSVFGSLLLHALLARLFKIDADTVIVTSVAAVCSPPFVPGVANALKNRSVILSGLYTGIIGYAVGNFAGVSMAYVLRLFA